MLNPSLYARSDHMELHAKLYSELGTLRRNATYYSTTQVSRGKPLGSFSLTNPAAHSIFRYFGPLLEISIELCSMVYSGRWRGTRPDHFNVFSSSVCNQLVHLTQPDLHKTPLNNPLVSSSHILPHAVPDSIVYACPLLLSRCIQPPTTAL